MLRLQNLLKNTVWQGNENFHKDSFRFFAEDTGAFDILKHLQTVCNQKGLGAPEVFSDESYPDINIVAEYIENRLDDNNLAEEYERICLQSDQLLAELSVCYKIAVGSNEIPVLVPRNCRHRLYYLDSPKNQNKQIENKLSFSFFEQKRNSDFNNRNSCNYNKDKITINNQESIFLNSPKDFSKNKEKIFDNKDYKDFKREYNSSESEKTCSINNSKQKGLLNNLWKTGKKCPLIRGLFFFIMIIAAFFVYQLPVGKNGSVLPGGNLIKSFFRKIPPVFDDITVHISGTPQLSDEIRHEHETEKNGLFDKNTVPAQNAASGEVFSLTGSQSNDSQRMTNSAEKKIPREQQAVKIAVASGSVGAKTFISDANFIIPPNNNAVFSKQNHLNE